MECIWTRRIDRLEHQSLKSESQNPTFLRNQKIQNFSDRSHLGQFHLQKNAMVQCRFLSFLGFWATWLLMFLGVSLAAFDYIDHSQSRHVQNEASGKVFLFFLSFFLWGEPKRVGVFALQSLVPSCEEQTFLGHSMSSILIQGWIYNHNSIENWWYVPQAFWNFHYFSVTDLNNRPLDGEKGWLVGWFVLSSSENEKHQEYSKLKIRLWSSSCIRDKGSSEKSPTFFRPIWKSHWGG